MDHWPKKVCVH
uniref:Receptor-like protein kinase At3g21340 n=1 Tax=Rhizophora mucronata TaxID=61149 RepID=A0A2P2MEY3_RHIMU